MHRAHVVWPVIANPEARDLSFTNGCGLDMRAFGLVLNRIRCLIIPMTSNSALTDLVLVLWSSSTDLVFFNTNNGFFKGTLLPVSSWYPTVKVYTSWAEGRHRMPISRFWRRSWKVDWGSPSPPAFCAHYHQLHDYIWFDCFLLPIAAIIGRWHTSTLIFLSTATSRCCADLQNSISRKRQIYSFSLALHIINLQRRSQHGHGKKPGYGFSPAICLYGRYLY